MSNQDYELTIWACVQQYYRVFEVYTAEDINYTEVVFICLN